MRRSLRYLTPEDDQLLGDLGTRIVYSPGDVLTRSGAPITALYVLRRGTVHVDVPHGAADGVWLAATDVLGEGVLVGADVAAVTIVAETEVHADVVDGRVLGEVLATRPGFASRLLRGVAHSLYERLLRLGAA